MKHNGDNGNNNGAATAGLIVTQHVHANSCASKAEAMTGLRLPLCDTCQLQISSLTNPKRISHQERLMLQLIHCKGGMRNITCLLAERDLLLDRNPV